MVSVAPASIMVINMRRHVERTRSILKVIPKRWSNFFMIACVSILKDQIVGGMAVDLSWFALFPNRIMTS